MAKQTLYVKDNNVVHREYNDYDDIIEVEVDELTDFVIIDGKPETYDPLKHDKILADRAKESSSSTNK